MQYTKGRLLKDGGEGYIYETRENPNLLMKIYKERDSSGTPIVTPELHSKLEYMKNNPPEALVSKGIIAWPIEVLTYEQSALVGFVMPKLDIDEHIQRVYSYRHPETESDEFALFPSVKSRISIAINLCSALYELHRKGYVIGDFNHANIGVNYKTGQIYAMDCDSLHITDSFGNVYRTNVIMAGYLAPEIIKHCNKERAEGRAYNLDKVSLPTFTKESDLFCLAVHIFKLLMNGIDPFRGVKSDATGSTASPFVGNEAIERNAYVFKAGNRPSAVFCPPPESLPPDVLALFNKAFIDGRMDPKLRPGADDWYIALRSYLMNTLAQCSSSPKHQFYSSLTECPYCAADNKYLIEQGIITSKHAAVPEKKDVNTQSGRVNQSIGNSSAARTSSQFWVCSKCEQYNEAIEIYCKSCGGYRKINQPIIQTNKQQTPNKPKNAWICKRCDDYNDWFMLFCKSCGTYR